MKCSQVEKLFSEYIDGFLDDNLCDRLEDHLATCSRCPKQLELLRRTVSELQKLDRVQAPADFLAQVHHKLQAEPKKKTIVERLFIPFHIKLPIEAIGIAASILIFVLMHRSLSVQNKLPYDEVESNVMQVAKIDREDFEKPMSMPLPQEKLNEMLQDGYEEAEIMEESPKETRLAKIKEASSPAPEDFKQKKADPLPGSFHGFDDMRKQAGEKIELDRDHQVARGLSGKSEHEMVLNEQSVGGGQRLRQSRSQMRAEADEVGFAEKVLKQKAPKQLASEIFRPEAKKKEQKIIQLALYVDPQKGRKERVDQMTESPTKEGLGDDKSVSKEIVFQDLDREDQRLPGSALESTLSFGFISKEPKKKTLLKSVLIQIRSIILSLEGQILAEETAVQTQRIRARIPSKRMQQLKNRLKKIGVLHEQGSEKLTDTTSDQVTIQIDLTTTTRI